MPLSELHASTIEVVQASFVFAEFACDPQEITEAISIVPDHVQRKGEPIELPNGLRQMAAFSSWGITSNSESKDINIHLRQLLQRLEGKEARIRIEWNPYFDILWKGTYLYAGSGPIFERDVMAGIARCQAELGLDIYQVDREPDEST